MRHASHEKHKHEIRVMDLKTQELAVLVNPNVISCSENCRVITWTVMDDGHRTSRKCVSLEWHGGNLIKFRTILDHENANAFLKKHMTEIMQDGMTMDMLDDMPCAAYSILNGHVFDDLETRQIMKKETNDEQRRT